MEQGRQETETVSSHEKENTQHLSSHQAVEVSVRCVEETLGHSKAYRKVDNHLYVVRQGSAYVMIVVLPYNEGSAIVRLVAQLVTGIEMSGELAQRLLCLNSRLRFGTFGYQKEGKVVTLSHSVLGGDSLAPAELLVAVEDLAELADDFDDRLVAIGGGSRMQCQPELACHAGG